MKLELREKEVWEAVKDLLEAGILREARRAELRSIEFYEKCLAEVGKPECKAIEVLIAAEKRHLKWVEFMRDYVLTHGRWYEMKKRPPECHGGTGI